ncbi:MAG: hypothetical protein K2P85_00905 [Flavobacteriaceae bacterium]|nr:hypothetical protein [Flavobacteriaceae bacterium]
MFENLLESVKVIDTDTGYWFVRTDSGDNFEAFRQHNFIGIGWNYITNRDLNNDSEDGRVIKGKISEEEGLDATSSADRRKITGIYNKIKRFQEFRVGDVIVMPNEGSSFLGFGTIEEENIYEELRDSDCDYIKRRKVKWHKFLNFSELDPIFYAIVQTRHAISNIKHYESYIDKTIDNLFIKDDDIHFVIDIEKKEDINIDSLLKLIDSINKVTESIDNEFNFEVFKDDRSIKLNLQSPGKIEFIFKKGKALILLAFLLSSNYAANMQAPNNLSREDLQNIIHVKEINQTDLDTISRTYTELEARKDRININD